MRLDRMMNLLQGGQLSILQMLSVRAGTGDFPAGLTVLDALCAGKGIRQGEDHFSTYVAICGRVVKAASRAGMLNLMSGSRGDTPLMKACANGNDTMVELLLGCKAGSSHLGLITPSVSIVFVCFFFVSLRKDLLGTGGGKAPWQLY